MARPLRIEFPVAVYHVTSRGNRRADIFVDDEDREALLTVVAQALSRFDAEALAEPRNSTALTSPGFSAASRERWPSGWQAARIGRRRYPEPTRKARSA
jgi:hypothetical protein